MTGILALDVCVALGMLAGGTAVVLRLLAVIKRVHDWLDDWQGEPARPGVAGRPGVMERLGAIEAQLRPNGGTSARDAVDRVEQTVLRVAETLEIQHREES